MRSWVHRVLKEDLGEKVTEAERTLLWLAAETEDRARRHEPGATAREDGHEVADAPDEDTRRATAWAWSSIARTNLCTTRTRPRRDLSVTWPSQGTFPGSHPSVRGPALARRSEGFLPTDVTITGCASAGRCPRSAMTKRRTLEYWAGKP